MQEPYLILAWDGDTFDVERGREIIRVEVKARGGDDADARIDAATTDVELMDAAEAILGYRLEVMLPPPLEVAL